MKKIQNYINGKLTNPINNSYIDNYEPRNGKIYSLIPNSNEKDINSAVKAAKKAFNSWSKTSKEDRADFLIAIANEIEKYFLGFYFRLIRTRLLFTLSINSFFHGCEAG